MKGIGDVSRGIFAALGGALSWFFGAMDGFMYALIALCVCDYITGVMCAIVNKKLSSAVGAKGIFKKILMFIVVGVAHIFDGVMHTGDVLRTAVVFFYLSNEGVSLIENAAILGLPVPEKFKNVLAQIKNKSGESGTAGGTADEQE